MLGFGNWVCLHEGKGWGSAIDWKLIKQLISIVAHILLSEHFVCDIRLLPQCDLRSSGMLHSIELWLVTVDCPKTSVTDYKSMLHNIQEPFIIELLLLLFLPV
jgi:hypothetical protein